MSAATESTFCAADRPRGIMPKLSPWRWRLASTGAACIVASLLVTPIAAQARASSKPLAPPGPTTSTPLAPPRSAQIATYANDAPQALSVYVTDLESAWASLARGLESAGIPFDMTTDWRRAVQHRVVLIYPAISGRVVPAEGLQALSALPRNGGTLIANELLGGGFEPLFGVDSMTPSAKRHRLVFTDSVAKAFGYIADRERTIPVGVSETDLRAGLAVVGTDGYVPRTATALARFDDGTAALTHRSVGSGHAWLFGIDLGSLLHLGYDNREDGIARSYVNGYEPTIDIALDVLRRIYRQGEPDAVIAGSVPFGRSLAVALTYDVDFHKDWPHALDFARLGTANGVRSTFFVQTKYIKDYSDLPFFDRDAVVAIRELDSLGMEIASHSVSHARIFRTFPIGTGTESYPAYRPFVKDRTTVTGGSVLGELRVSRWLLESANSGAHLVTSFRPGHLANPFALPQALEATGYRASSSMTANNALTHRPFRLSFDRVGAAESRIWEFPVTIEDEEKPSLPERVGAALALARDIARTHGTMVVLVHPTESTGKLRFVEQLIAGLRDSAAILPVGSLASWWAARTATTISSVRHGDGTATVTLRPVDAVDGFAFDVPDGWTLLAADGATQQGRTVVVARLDKERRCDFTVAR
jgi:peptidoglycan/xylan/chitin deacetylase (PgdA/CDA1 family)